MKENIVGRPPHVLDGVVIRKTSTSWRDRVKTWNRFMAFHERIQWLHGNYHRDGNSPDPFIFYLEVADRYGMKGIFDELPGHGENNFVLDGGYRTLAEQKRKIAIKAFTILCTEYFAEKPHQECQYPYTLPYESPLFEKFLWFFRPCFEGGPGGWDNLRPYVSERLGKDGGKHYLDTARKFAKQFITYAWPILNGYWYGPFEKEDLRTDVVRPHLKQVVGLMLHLSVIDCIAGGQYVPSPEVFNEMVDLVVQGYYTRDPKPAGEPYKGKALDAGVILEPFVAQGDRLARVLYLARFEVDHWHANRRGSLLK